MYAFSGIFFGLSALGVGLYRVVWLLHIPLDLILNWSRRLDNRRRFVGVVYCGILSSSAQKMTSCVGVATPVVGVLVMGSYVSCMSSRGLRIVEYLEKNYPLTKNLHRDSNPLQFPVLWPWFLDLLFETNKFCFGTVLLLCLVLELHKTSSRQDSNPGQFSVLWRLFL
jgi:hypothetical protein